MNTPTYRTVRLTPGVFWRWAVQRAGDVIALFATEVDAVAFASRMEYGEVKRADPPAILIPSAPQLPCWVIWKGRRIAACRSKVDADYLADAMSGAHVFDCRTGQPALPAAGPGEAGPVPDQVGTDRGSPYRRPAPAAHPPQPPSRPSLPLADRSPLGANATCGGCVFWWHNHDKWGECRVNPPDYSEPRFPTAFRNEWCGEFQPKR